MCQLFLECINQLVSSKYPNYLVSTQPSKHFTYHEINSLYDRTSYFIKLHMSHSKSVYKEHQEEDIWYKEKNVKNPDGTVHNGSKILGES